MTFATDHLQRVIAAARRLGRLLAAPALARYGAPAISIAILAAAVFELHALDWQAVLAVVPRSPWFWMVFAVFYVVPTFAEWCIYRQIWQVPGSAIVAMMRKTVSNDLLIGYVGETYLYAWARRAGRDPATAFGAVKDVSILSAAVGGCATMAVMLCTAPYLGRLDLHLPVWGTVLAGTAIMAPPMVALLGRNRVFHLPRALLMRIAAIHAARSASGIVLTALLWHLALPGIALSWWVILSALKVLLSRLPLASNKELVFAGTIAALLGHHGAVPALMAMLAGLMVAAHVATGIAASAGGMIDTAAGHLRTFAPRRAPARRSA